MEKNLKNYYFEFEKIAKQIASYWENLISKKELLHLYKKAKALRKTIITLENYQLK